MSGGLALSWVHEDRRGAVRRAMLGRLGSAHAVLVAPWLARSAWLHTLRADSSHVTRLMPRVRVRVGARLFAVLCVYYCARNPGRMRSHGGVGCPWARLCSTTTPYDGCVCPSVCVCVRVCGGVELCVNVGVWEPWVCRPVAVLEWGGRLRLVLLALLLHELPG